MRLLSALSATVLLTVFVLGCDKGPPSTYQRRAWATEVAPNLKRIHDGLMVHHLKKGGGPDYRFPAAGPTPGKVPCGQKPVTGSAGLWKAPGWRAVDFSIETEFRYQYRIISQGRGPMAAFTIRAHGDLDCDGVLSTYERYGQVDERGRLKWTAEIKMHKPEE